MKKILLIEDTPNIRENIEEYLELSGHQVLIAENGSSGLALLRDEKPDLVICDVKMPQLSGFELKAKANEDPELRAIPFVFLSAATQKEDIARGKALGALAYLTKPFDMGELLKWVSDV